MTLLEQLREAGTLRAEIWMRYQSARWVAFHGWGSGGRAGFERRTRYFYAEAVQADARWVKLAREYCGGPADRC